MTARVAARKADHHARADHPFRSVNGGGRCVAWVGTLEDGRACNLTPADHHARPTTGETT